MTPKKHIDQFDYALSRFYGSTILSRGNKLYIEDAIESIVYREDIESYKITVMGSRLYTVQITISDTYHYPMIDCTCPYSGYCKHGAAALKKLLEKSYGSESNKKKSKTKSIRIKKMEHKKASEWRKVLGLETADNITKTLKFHGVHGYYNREYKEIEVIGQSHYRLKNDRQSNAHYYYYQYEEASIDVKKEDGAIYVKCNICDKKTFSFCSHQVSMLHTDDDTTFWFLGNLIEGNHTDYEDLMQTIQETIGTNKKQIEKYFTIVCDKQGYRAKAKKGVVANSSYLDEVLNFIDNDVSEFAPIDKNTKQDGYALVWDAEDLSIVKGKMNKTKTKISSHLSEVDMYSIIDQKLRSFYMDLSYLISMDDTTGIIKFLKDSVDYISSKINMINTHYGEIKKSYLNPLIIKDDFLKIRLIFSYENPITNVTLELYTDKELVPLDEVDKYSSYMAFLKGSAYIFNSKYGHKFIDLFKRVNGELVIFDEVAKSSELYQFLMLADDIVNDGYELRELSGGKKEIYIDQAGGFISMRPMLTYDEEKYDILESRIIRDYSSNIGLEANLEEVTSFTEEFRELLSLLEMENEILSSIMISENKITYDRKFLEILDFCGTHDIEVLGDEDVLFSTYTTAKPSINISFSSGIDWFDSNVELAFGDLNVTSSQWVDAIKEKRNYVLLSNGKKGILPDKWLKKLKQLSSVGEVSKNGNIKINKLRFNVLDDMFEDIDDEALKEEITKKKEALANYEVNKSYKMPRGLKAKLRPYQKQGYQWMKFLEEFGFGGCLADDMGLGKTIQVLTLLLDQKKQKKGTSLVVVPRSLLFNWQTEIDKFTPTILAHIHHGVARTIDEDEFSKRDIIITTYDTCVRDIEQFSNIHFNYIILDESQAIKNPNSKRYKAMRLLKADHRLVMTGTPVENNSLDLFAQFSFINPGLLGSLTSFKNNFARRIDVNNDVEATDTLRKIMYPFILRRKKENVAKDLPQKTESILYCEMDKVQRAMYEELKNNIRIDLNKNIAKEGINKSKFKILDGLLRLRQMCNATQLTSKNLVSAKKKSVKIDTLIEQLKDLGIHKALVFSQFVGMLSIVRERLDKEGMKYAYLDGSTRNRQKAVSDFMEDDTCNIFLISIKAGNSGLNLTKADYVYILDPWWNPAIEAQAIDRTHRIGQDKPIFAYKMICKDTIEEKIVQLQSKKKKLASDLVQADENVFKSLGKEDLMSLFN